MPLVWFIAITLAMSVAFGALLVLMALDRRDGGRVPGLKRIPRRAA